MPGCGATGFPTRPSQQPGEADMVGQRRADRAYRPVASALPSND
uniref:Uncharacterized protein n=1 Tax=uncultured gamma proteobacterium HF4000_48E10 TaxID=723583 RepID=E7C8R8_9GAMM|nr:hypothetical protein [uncultured gamma proteobacterium HF4000_48E10]